MSKGYYRRDYADMIVRTRRGGQMEMCNEIAGSYKMPSSKSIAATMRMLSTKEQDTQTSKRISSFLQKASTRNNAVTMALRNVYKVQEMHTKANIVRERKLRRANRMTIIHPSKIADGNYNS